MKSKRSSLLVDRKVQLALLYRILFHWACFAFLSFSILFGLECFRSEPGQTMGQLLFGFWVKYSIFYCTLFVTIPLFAYDSLKLSNRFAGPMLRLKSSMQKLANDEPVDEIKFRSGDFWSELSGSFNSLLNNKRQQSS